MVLTKRNGSSKGSVLFSAKSVEGKMDMKMNLGTHE